MDKKNLVIGAIKEYPYHKIANFVESLKNTKFTGDLCLMVNDVDDDTLTQLRQQQVICYPMPYRGGALNSWSRFWPTIKPLCTLLPHEGNRMILKKILPLQTARFLHYKDFLIANQARYNQVLLTDVRDVFFQDDPFTIANHNKIQCYEEYLVIGDELVYNVPWIKALFGNDALDSFADCKILCSGTILGPVSAMIAFLTSFEKILLEALDVSLGGSDQGAYNYLIRTRLFENVDIVPYDKGEILTVTPAVDYTDRVKNNYLFNKDNLLVPVVHQYDRSPVVLKAVQAQLK